MRHSVYANTLAKATLTITTRSSNATVNGTGVDRMSTSGSASGPYRTAMLVVHTGTITDGTHAVKLQESDDNSTFTDVAGTDLQGSAISVGSSDDDKVFELGYVGSKRYLRASVTTSAATSGGTFGATILLGFPRRNR